MNSFPRSVVGLAVLALALALPVAALAGDGPSRDRSHDNRGGNHDKRGHEGRGADHDKRGGGRSRAPEFDPTAVGAIAAMVAGGTVLLARRRKA